MSSLRKCLRYPGIYLGLIVVLGSLIWLDGLRAPDRQFSAVAYVGFVHAYQRAISPEISGAVRCRYEPTCSHYSTEAVQKYGIGKGLALTAKRLWRCRGNVPFGTLDPVH